MNNEITIDNFVLWKLLKQAEDMITTIDSNNSCLPNIGTLTYVQQYLVGVFLLGGPMLRATVWNAVLIPQSPVCNVGRSHL